MNQYITTSDPIGEAIAVARKRYMPDLCCSSSMISRLLHAVSKAGNLLVEADDTIVPEAFFETYLRKATAYEEVMNHSDYPGFKAEVEGAWFGECDPNPFLTMLDCDDMASALQETLIVWRRANGKSTAQMLENLAIQKVLLAAASATSGEEEGFIEDDYRATQDHMTDDLDPAVITRLENRCFRGNGTLFVRAD